jgi:hypothetical protein
MDIHVCEVCLRMRLLALLASMQSLAASSRSQRGSEPRPNASSRGRHADVTETPRA